MSVLNFTCRSIIASTNGAVTHSDALCAVGDVAVGLGKPRSPNQNGKVVVWLAWSRIRVSSQRGWWF